VDYDLTWAFRVQRLRRAFEAFKAGGGLMRREFVRFVTENAAWLEDFALYIALKRANGGRDWLHWQRDERLRRAAALARARERYADEIQFERFVQFQFDRQWRALRGYAHERDVGLIGDIPIFVALDSADVWANPRLFRLRPDGRPELVSGVPPDAFSRNGQLWGHPHYRWEAHRRTGFAWWIARFRQAFAQFDAVRIDHFLGFARCWAVPGGAKAARRGRWVRTPGRQLLDAVRAALGPLEILAEDLGVVTRQAVALRESCGFPGMRMLQWGFGDDAGASYNRPHSYVRNCIACTGTHDGDTVVGWFKLLKKRAEGQRRRTGSSDCERFLNYAGSDGKRPHWDMIRLTYASIANTAIVPVQDVLGLDNRARMNLPGTPTGNWEWRLRERELASSHGRRLRELAGLCNRLAKRS